uniref:Tetraspanin-9 n=1 Tax=Oryctolagus cuniculus TaxID=9986 RepID=A0A5F9DUM5_RABIT
MADITNRSQLSALLGQSLGSAHHALGTHHQLSGTGTTAGSSLPFLAISICGASRFSVGDCCPKGGHHCWTKFALGWLHSKVMSLFLIFLQEYPGTSSFPSAAKVCADSSKNTEFKKCNMARGCLCCLKYMMFLFNLIFWLCGCGLLGVGIWLSVSQGNFATFSPSFPSLSAANLVIAMGTIVMVTGFLGCLGAIKENKCLLLSFFIVLLAILLAELILLILFFVYMDKVNENAKKDLKEGLLLYNTENNVGLKNAWNIIQAEMRCCGVTDYTDWYPVLGENTVPDRCCMENSQGCGRNATTTALWKTGCYEKVKMWFDDNKHVLGTVGMCVLIMQ